MGVAALSGADRWVRARPPGFGSADKPREFDYSIGGFDRWIESFTNETGLDHYQVRTWLAWYTHIT